MFSTSETKPMVFFSGGFNVLGICMGKSPNLPECWGKWMFPPQKRRSSLKQKQKRLEDSTPFLAGPKTSSQMLL